MNKSKDQFMLLCLAVLGLTVSALLVDLQVFASAYVLDRLAVREFEKGPLFVTVFRSMTTAILILVPLLSFVSAMCVFFGWKWRKFLVPATLMAHILASFFAGWAVVLYIVGWVLPMSMTG